MSSNPHAKGPHTHTCTALFFSGPFLLLDFWQFPTRSIHRDIRCKVFDRTLRRPVWRYTFANIAFDTTHVELFWVNAFSRHCGSRDHRNGWTLPRFRLSGAAQRALCCARFQLLCIVLSPRSTSSCVDVSVSRIPPTLLKTSGVVSATANIQPREDQSFVVFCMLSLPTLLWDPGPV